jgi:protein associated with RNAse G/E
MYEYKKQEKFIIHSYKHNGNIHREWDEAILLDVQDEYLVFGNNKTKVLESDGRSWKTKEPAIMFFYKKNTHSYKRARKNNSKRKNLYLLTNKKDTTFIY